MASSSSLIEVAATSYKSTSSTPPPRKELDFNWCLKPFQIFVKLISGVDLFSSTRPSTSPSTKNTYRWLQLFTWVHIWLVLFVNVIINAMWSVELIKQIIPLDANETNEYLLNTRTGTHLLKDIFGYLNSNIFYLSLHLYFLYITHWSSKWNDFWSEMQTIQKECSFNKELFYECRRTVFFAFIFMLTDFLINFSGSFCESYWNDYTIIKPFYIIGMNLVYLLDTVIMCLLMIIVKWVTYFIKTYKQRLMNTALITTKENNSDRLKLFAIELYEWKKQHSLIYQLFHRFNNLSGFFVLLILYYRFVNVINYAFMIWFCESKDTFYEYYSVSSFLNETFKLWFIIYIFHQLQSEGTRLIKSFLRINGMFITTHYELRALIRSTLTQVIYCQPIITAAGFCDVNLSLLLTILGSAFAYLLMVRDVSSIYLGY